MNQGFMGFPPAQAPLGPITPYILLQDQKAQNTVGGTYTSGAWRTRDLNTEVIDTHNLCTLANNQFTLQPGTYKIYATAPGYNANAMNHICRLQNISLGTTIATGTSMYSAAASESVTALAYMFTITVPTVFEFQHIMSLSQSSIGFGVNGNLAAELYAQVELWKVA